MCASRSAAPDSLLAYRGRNIPFRISLPGRFNVYNSLAAISVGLSEGMEPALIQSTLAGVAGVPGRFQVVDHGQEFTVVVDYAHTPDGLENVLRTARALTRGHLIAVFGCGGDRDTGKRPLMGKISGQLCDLSILTSDNPRSEEPREHYRPDRGRDQGAPGCSLRGDPRPPGGDRARPGVRPAGGLRGDRRQGARNLPDHRRPGAGLR